MLFSKDPPKPRRFPLWIICLLLSVIGTAYIVVHLASRPSEPLISVHMFSTNVSWQTTVVVSNRMSFDVEYCIGEVELISRTWVPIMSGVSDTRNWTDSSLLAHSQIYIVVPSRAVKLQISCKRQLKPMELSVLNKLPWLKGHYPFSRRRFFNIYEPVSDFQVSSETKQQTVVFKPKL